MATDTPATYGKGIYGRAVYGRDMVVYDPRYRLFSLVAWKKFGKTESPIEGIYQRQPSLNGQIVRKLKFYVPTNPQTEAQQANRQKIADAVSAWQALTDEQKDVYNKKALGKGISGYNLFIKNYLRSN